MHPGTSRHLHKCLGLRLVKAGGTAWPRARVPGAAGARPCPPLNFEAGPGSPPQPGAVSSPAAAPWRCVGPTVTILPVAPVETLSWESRGGKKSFVSHPIPAQ